MTVTLQLRPEEVTALHGRADAEGVDIETVLHSLVAQIAPPPPAPMLSDKNRAAMALMQAWREEDKTDDPEELAERDREPEEFKANMNRWRAEEGRPSVY